MKRTPLLLLFSLIFIGGLVAGESGYPGTRYWVGGSGNWNDPKHWSEKSGGMPGATVPTSVNDVALDNNSLLGDGDGVFLEGEVQCRSMIWKDIITSPILTGSASSSITIYGSLAFVPEMANQFKGKIIFKSSSKGNTIVTANHFFYGDVVFDGEGEWKLLDDVRTKNNSSILLIRGSLNTNSKNIHCYGFISSGEKKRSLGLGSSHVTVREKWDFSNSTNLLFDAGSSKIILPKAKSDTTFTGGNLKYNDVVISMGLCNDSPPTDCIPFTITITTTPDSCAGGATNGTATANISGGSGPFTYDWNFGAQTTQTATGLGAGTHGVQVTDGLGNICSCNGVISVPAVLGANTTSTPATCNGICDGTAGFLPGSPGGGVSPYTYLWSPTGQTTSTATGLCGAVTYSVLITDAYGCTIQRTRAVTQPAPLAPNGSSTNLLCFGVCIGTASVSPTGGTAPYTYAWLPGGQTTSTLSALCANNYTCTVTDANLCTNTYTTTITQPPQLTTTVTGSNLLCNSVCTGSVTATSSGGTGSYTYSWAPGGATTSAVTGLCANTYTLTLSDANGCAVTATITLTQPGVLTTAPGLLNVTCNGLCNGSVSVNPSGGTTPYTYTWSPGGCTTDTCLSLCPNTYSITVADANGCTATNAVTVTEPSPLVVTPSAVDIICPGFCNGSASATVAGGSAPYTYSWAPGGATTTSITGLCAGTYTINITDVNGCIATNSVTVNMPSPLIPNLSSTNVTCFGSCNGSVTSAATGGTPAYTYFWSPGGATTSSVTGLCAGNYTLTLTDSNGCPASATVAVTQPATYTASISSATPNPLNCNGDCNGTAAVTVGGGTPLYTYLWTTGGTNASVSGLCAGVYSVTVTDANGCTAVASVTFLQPSTLSVTIASSNPSCSSTCDGSISAIAGGGTPGYTFAWLPGGQTTGAIGSLCPGTYTITVTDNNGCANTQTITLTPPFTLLANASVVNNVSCAGACDGSATTAPSGGTAPFTYLWTGGQTTSTATGLCAGTFSVTVTDASGCTDLDVITITQPSVLSTAISSTTSSCTLCNGTASITTSGGTTPYTFLWSDGQSTSAAVGLCAGNYTVDVTDANGCLNTVTLTISPVVTLTITVSGTSVSCPGACDGIANATPFGGASPYTYSWTTAPVQTTASATGLCAGSYTVNVSDANGCLSSNTLTFSNPPALVAGMSSTTASCGLCNGTATVAPAGGTGTYTYSWSGFPVQTTATATGLCGGNYTVTLSDANNCAITNTVAVGTVPAISDNPSTTLAACGISNGSLCVSPTGGTPGYTYLWAPGGETTGCITAVAAGIYTVVITDAAGCTGAFLNTVGNIPGPTVTVTFQADPLCNADCNGSISVSTVGTNPPFDYFWNPTGQTTTTATGLCAGMHIAQVIDQVPCTTFVSVTLVDPPQLVANPVITNVNCSGGNNGSICLSPTGGVSPYTYTWSPGGQSTSCITGLTAGTYTVVVADAQACDDTLFIPVSAPSTLSVTISSTNVTCNGNNDGTATATVTGGTALYTYSWMPGGGVLPIVVGLSPNTYTLTVTDNNGCMATATVTITQPVVLTTTISSTNITCNSLCNGTATISAAGGTTAYTYSWLPGGQTTSTITGLCVGNYVGTVTDLNGCSSTQSVAITQPPVISATITTTPASCFGGCNGTASVVASGGTGAFTYLWNPGGQTTTTATGLCAGSYTLSITDANGCGYSQLFSITAPTVLQANITNVSPTCFGYCDGTATSSPIGGTGPYTFSWNTVPVQTTATATGLCSGSYTLTLSDVNGCFINQPVTIAAPPALTQANGVAGATCNLCNGSIALIASGGTPPYSFFWSTGATTATITGLCAGVYIDTVMDSKGCLSLDTIPVSNTTGPLITVASTSVTCFGACNGTGTVTSSTGDGPPWIYLWTFTGQTTQTATGLCVGQHFATVEDTNGCKTILPINIIQPAQLLANPTINNATCFGVCNGSIVTGASGGTGAYTYLWNPGLQTTTSITGQCAGTYTLTLTDANNCVQTSTVTIGQNTILTSTITSTNVPCNLSCIGTATATIGGGTMPYTYSWAPTGQTTSTATGLCAGTHTIIATDAIGCVRIDSAIITQPTLLNANITAVNPLCTSLCNGSISAAPTGGTPAYTYLWSPGGATTTSITGLCSGTYTLALTDANSCISTTTISLTDPPLLTATFVVTNASCANTCDGSINLTPSGGTGAYTFTWSNSAVTEDVSNLCPGNYSVTITDGNGCVATYTMNVGVVTLVISAAGNDTSFCVGGTATLTSSSINATSIGWWQIGSPAWTFIGSTTSINQSPPVGTTSYALIAVNGICSDTDTVNVIVNAYPVLVSTNDTSICQGDSVTLCTSGAAGYQWYLLPAWTPITTGSCITVSPALGTTSYGIIGMNGVCSDTDSVSVTVLIMPTALAGNDVSICFGNNVTLCSSSLNTTSVSWYALPGWTLVDTTVCISVTPPAGVNDFALIASNGICSDTDTVSVTVYPAPPVDAGSNATILSGSSTLLNGSGSGTYVWTPSTGLSSTTISNPTASPTVSTTYTLMVTDTSGCTSFDTVRVTVILDIVVNDGISPNGDGINDFWEIPNIESFPGALVEVYNRWGELLHSTTDYKNNKWDGTYMNKELPVGTYYYVINLNSALHKDPITGPITVLR